MGLAENRAVLGLGARRVRCGFRHSTGILCALALTLASFAAWAADPQRDPAAAEGKESQAADPGPADPTPADPGSAGEPVEEPPATERTAAPSSTVETIKILGKASAVEIGEPTASQLAFGADELQALGVGDVSDIDQYVPNLEIVTVSATTPTFFIRGIGLNDFNANAPGAIAVYKDGVAINAPAIQLGSLFDVQGVEILRGPQGDNRFRNASGGVIGITSRRPSGDFGATLRADYGNYNFVDFEGAVEAPIIPEILSSRFAFRHTDRNPFYNNRCGNQIDKHPAGLFGQGTSVCGEAVATLLNGDVFIEPDWPGHVNDKGNWAARGTLLFEPPVADLDMEWTASGHYAQVQQDAALGQVLGTEFVNRFTGPATASWHYVDPKLQEIYDRIGKEVGATTTQDFRTVVAPLALAEATRDIDSVDPFDGAYTSIGPEELDTYGGFLEGKISFESFDLRTITGGEGYERLRDTDFDFSPNPAIGVNVTDDAWQITQSVDLEGELGSETLPLHWSLGAFYLTESLKSATEFALNASMTALKTPIFQEYQQDLHSGGMYGNVSWDLLDGAFTLDAGARYNVEYKTFDLSLRTFFGEGGSDDDVLWTAPTGRIGLTWNATEDVSLYGKYTRGWKPGHFNASVLELPAGGPQTERFKPDITVADPETIDSFEVGVNSSWLDGLLTVEAAAFYYTYSDYQVFLLSNEAGKAPQFEVLNANDAEIYGAELDVVLRPIDPLLITARMGWLESEFLDFTDTRSARKSLGNLTVTQSVPIDFTGNRLPNSPRYKASGAAEYTFDLGRFGLVTPRYDFAYTDRTFFDPSEGRGVPALTRGANSLTKYLTKDAISQRAYILHNVRLTWSDTSERMQVAFWVRNVTDEVYKTFVADATANFASLLNFIGEPRTYGVSLSLKY